MISRSKVYSTWFWFF